MEDFEAKLTKLQRKIDSFSAAQYLDKDMSEIILNLRSLYAERDRVKQEVIVSLVSEIEMLKKQDTEEVPAQMNFNGFNIFKNSFDVSDTGLIPFTVIFVTIVLEVFYTIHTNDFHYIEVTLDWYCIMVNTWVALMSFMWIYRSIGSLFLTSPSAKKVVKEPNSNIPIVGTTISSPQSLVSTENIIKDISTNKSAANTQIQELLNPIMQQTTQNEEPISTTASDEQSVAALTTTLSSPSLAQEPAAAINDTDEESSRGRRRNVSRSRIPQKSPSKAPQQRPETASRALSSSTRNDDVGRSGDDVSLGFVESLSSQPQVQTSSGCPTEATASASAAAATTTTSDKKDPKKKSLVLKKQKTN